MYAIRKDGKGWRAIDSAQSVGIDEYYSEVQPPVAPDRLGEILQRLSAIDIESIRPLRAIAADSATGADMEKLAALDEEADSLRKELSSL